MSGRLLEEVGPLGRTAGADGRTLSGRWAREGCGSRLYSLPGSGTRTEKTEKIVGSVG